MRCLRLLAALAAAIIAPATGISASRVLQLPSGDQLVIGSQLVTLTTLDSAQAQVWQITVSDSQANFPSYPLSYEGHGNTILGGAAVDPSGNIWIVGITDSDDFPLVNPIFSQKPAYQPAGFAMEVNPTGSQVLFSTYLGSASPEGTACSTSASAIATDSAGNVYIGGSTDEPDFLAATPPPAYQDVCLMLAGGGPETLYYSFVVKISAAGKLVYGKRLITGTSQCVGGSVCIGQTSTAASVGSLAVDSTGAVIVAGIASGSWNPGRGYILKLSSDGSNVLWSFAGPSSFPAVLAMNMVQDTAGNLDLFGQYATLIQNLDYAPGIATPGLFAAQLKPDGSALNYLADLGQSADAQIGGMVLDSSGKAYLAGTSSFPQLPSVAGLPNLGPDFVIRMDASAAAVETLYRLPRGVVTAPPGFDQHGNLLLVGANNWLATLPLSSSTPSIVGFANSASYAWNTGILKGALVTLFGFALPSSADQVQVSINNLPAAILYAGPNQINLQVPFGIIDSLGNLPVEVTLPGGTLSLQVPWSPSLGIFTVDGTYAAALNQDGTVNSASNPAAAGSIVSLFGTGAFWSGGMQTGAVASTLVAPFIPILVLNYPEVISPSYAGTAPGLIDGVFQVNVQLPAQPYPAFILEEGADVGPGPLYSNAVKLYLK